jgi:PAS domain S-box-containing protein
MDTIAKEAEINLSLTSVVLKEAIRAKRPPAPSDSRYLQLFDAISAAVYTIDAAGRLTFYNRAAVDLWGYSPTLGTRAWCGSWRLYWPDGRPMAHDECPMAIALKERRSIKGAEAIAQRPDGTLVPFVAYPTPLYDSAGELTGALNLLLDMTERKRIEQSGWSFNAIFESSEDAILTVDLGGMITSANPSAERLFGYTATELVGQSVTLLYPPHLSQSQSEIVQRVCFGESIDHYETVRQRKDGTLVDISLTVSPIRNSEGKAIGASKIARDTTERKRAQEQQLLLLEEMNHRVRNLFALTGSLISLSARSASSVKELDEALRSRLMALSHAHELTLPVLTETEIMPARPSSLADLVSTVFAPYDCPGQDGQRIVAQGPDIQIGGKALTSLALLLHEFATNAAKHGALSTPSGRVNVSWTTARHALELTWEEHGGPSLFHEPAREGFGSALARAAVTGFLGGQLARDWTPEGLEIHLSVPLDHLLQ